MPIDLKELLAPRGCALLIMECQEGIIGAGSGRLSFVGILHLLGRCGSVMKLGVLSRYSGNQKKSDEGKCCN